MFLAPMLTLSSIRSTSWVQMNDERTLALLYQQIRILSAMWYIVSWSYKRRLVWNHNQERLVPRLFHHLDIAPCAVLTEVWSTSCLRELRCRENKWVSTHYNKRRYQSTGVSEIVNVHPCEGGRTILQYEAAGQLEGGIYSDLLA